MPWIVIGSIVLVIVLVIGAIVGYRYFSAGSADPGPLQPGGRFETGEIVGVQGFDDLSQDHTEGTVDYPQHPPVGGEHAPEWLNCGVYDKEVPKENAVHSLEHGAVWITYDPALPTEDVEVLRGLYRSGGYLVISPMADLPGTVVASAWGKQLIVEDADDERLRQFLGTYEQGPQTPEVGAPCSGQIGEPLVS